MKRIDQIIAGVADNFRSFGGGKYTVGNPVAYALADKPPQFAAGVDIRAVVEFVLKADKKLKRSKKGRK